MSLRAVIYARVSSLTQREAQTIDSQLRVLPEFVRARGWILAAPASTYVDDGMTAKAGHLDKRVAFTRLLRDAAAGKFDVVVVIDLDRLTRSEDITERGQVLGAFQRAGVQLAVASTGQVLDLSSSTGDLFATLQAFFAAEENRKRRERSLRGRAQAIRRGKNPCGPAPYGLRYSDAAGWTIDGPQAELVRELYRRLVAGESCPTIGRDLELRGVASPRGGRWAAAVWNLVTKATYRGVYAAGGLNGGTVAVPRIVDDELWQAAQEALVRSRRAGLDRTKHEYLAAKIGRCASCGGGVWTAPGFMRASGTVKPAYYVCTRRRYPRHGETACESPWHNVADVDGRVWRKVVELATRPDTIERALTKRGDLATERGDWAADMDGYQAKLERLEAAQKAILRRFSKGVIPEAVMDAELATAGRERAFLEQQIAAARSRSAGLEGARASIDAVVAQLGAVRGKLADAPFAFRRQITTALCSAIVLGPGGTVELDIVLARAARPAAMAPASPRTNSDDCASREPLRIRVVA